MGDLTPLTLLAPSPHMVIFVMLHKQIAFKESLGQEFLQVHHRPTLPTPAPKSPVFQLSTRLDLTSDFANSEFFVDSHLRPWSESPLLVKFELVDWRSVDYKVVFLEPIVKSLKLLESVDVIWCVIELVFDKGILVSDLPVWLLYPAARCLIQRCQFRTHSGSNIRI